MQKEIEVKAKIDDFHITKALAYGGDGINALQLDMTWPDAGEIENALRVSEKEIEVILQIGTTAFTKANNDHKNVVEKLRWYEGLIQYVLLDASVGRGIQMDPDALMIYACAIRKAFPELGIVIAGGLGPSTVELIEPFARKFPDISIDAEGKLRSSGSILDPVDWYMAEMYLTKALQILR